MDRKSLVKLYSMTSRFFVDKPQAGKTHKHKEIINAFDLHIQKRTKKKCITNQITESSIVWSQITRIDKTKKPLVRKIEWAIDTNRESWRRRRIASSGRSSSCKGVGTSPWTAWHDWWKSACRMSTLIGYHAASRPCFFYRRYNGRHQISCWLDQR